MTLLLCPYSSGMRTRVKHYLLIRVTPTVTDPYCHSPSALECDGEEDEGGCGTNSLSLLVFPPLQTRAIVVLIPQLYLVSRVHYHSPECNSAQPLLPLRRPT